MHRTRGRLSSLALRREVRISTCLPRHLGSLSALEYEEVGWGGRRDIVGEGREGWGCGGIRSPARGREASSVESATARAVEIS